MGGIFDQIFGGGGRSAAEDRTRGADLRYDLQLGLDEAAKGCEREIVLEKMRTCPDCNGSGGESGSKAVTCRDCGGRGQVVTSRGFFHVSQTCSRCQGMGQLIDKPCRRCGGEGRSEGPDKIKLRIPAGIESGTRLRSSGQGEAGIRRGTPGDLYVVVHIKKHEVFERDGNNLFCEVPISFSMAALGGEVGAPTLDGKAPLKIPAGTQSGTVFKLRGKGMPELNSRAVGDLLVTVLVEVPTKLNDDQRKKLAEFAESMGEENSPIHQSFFERAKSFFS
jgi:molecular chaperone DnaJ